MKINILKKDEAEIAIEERIENEIEYYDIKIRFLSPTIPKPIKLTFYCSEKNLYSVFSSSAKTERHLKPCWSANKCNSRLASNMPLLTAITRDGLNGTTISLSDAKIPTELSFGMMEENGFARCTVILFSSPISETDSVDLTLRIDNRKIRYEEAIKNAVEWWETDCGYTPAYVPNEATLPMNSAWYSYHQNIDVEDIIDECNRSKELGMETIIIDDGWQTEDVSLGYAFCGDWEVCDKKISSMKKFVDRVHGEGMKFMLWYSVPYVGINSKAFERFKDKLLDYDEKRKWFCLDPRFPDVREYLVNIYKTALTEYGLDGFKLDFIDAFKLTEQSLIHNPKRDTESLEDSIDMLLNEIYTSLTEIKPDVLIEFRQTYVGPTIKKYANMLRVADCPADPLRNRFSIADLRLTSNKTAVHSDMLLWNENQNVEDAAAALVSVLYGVVQVSVKLKKLPEDHLKMLKFYLSFMREHRDTLLFGSFTADNPESLYSRISASNSGKIITTLYDRLYEKIPESFESFILVNGTASNDIILETENQASGKIVNCLGQTVQTITLKEGLNKVFIPTCGMIMLYH